MKKFNQIIDTVIQKLKESELLETLLEFSKTDQKEIISQVIKDNAEFSQIEIRQIIEKVIAKITSNKTDSNDLENGAYAEIMRFAKMKAQPKNKTIYTR